MDELSCLKIHIIYNYDYDIDNLQLGLNLVQWLHELQGLIVVKGFQEVHVHQKHLLVHGQQGLHVQSED